MRKAKQTEPEPMVLYNCPYCGELNMQRLSDVLNDYIWCCVHCGYEMITA